MSQNQNPRAPSIAQLFAIADNLNRASAPQAVVGQPVLQAQHGQSATSDRSSRWIPPHLRIVPAPSHPNLAMTGQVPPPNTPAATAVGFQGHSHGIPGTLTLNPNPTPTIIYDVTGRIGGGGGGGGGVVHPPGYTGPAVPATVPRSYIADLQRGNVGVNYVWKESTLGLLAEFELEILRVLEEKARAFWKLWVDLSEPQSETRDMEKALRFAARQLRVYSWFRGDETVKEAMEAVRKIHVIYVEFMTRNRGGPARILVAPANDNRMPQGAVPATTMASQAEAQMRTEGGTQCQAQVREVEDAEE